jgi:hypothetical protein
VITSSWATELNSATITSRESAATNTTSCNGQAGTSLELTGQNSQCISRYGIEDMAGNAWEWTNERSLDASGYVAGGALSEEEFKIDVTNKDLDDFLFNHYTSPTLLKDTTCISIPMRMPVSISGLCPDGSYNPADLPGGGAATLYNSYYFPPGAGARYLLAGGTFGASGHSSVYTLAWVPFNFANAAARCAIRVD